MSAGADLVRGGAWMRVKNAVDAWKHVEAREEGYRRVEHVSLILEYLGVIPIET